MKFAANLGSSPLEPMKILQPTIATTTNTTKLNDTKSAVPAIDVPAAQFDWNSSGLTNPLDGNVNAYHIHFYSIFFFFQNN